MSRLSPTPKDLTACFLGIALISGWTWQACGHQELNNYTNRSQEWIAIGAKRSEQELILPWRRVFFKRHERFRGFINGSDPPLSGEKAKRDLVVSADRESERTEQAVLSCACADKLNILSVSIWSASLTYVYFLSGDGIFFLFRL